MISRAFKCRTRMTAGLHYVILLGGQQHRQFRSVILATRPTYATVHSAQYLSFRGTFADIVAGQALNLAEVVGLLDDAAHPRLKALLEKLKSRPAFDRVFHPESTA